MKKTYETPCLEVQLYQLDMRIASNCAEIVNAGPQDPVYCKDGCPDWEALYGDTAVAAASYNYNVSIYGVDSTAAPCDCYYTAGNTGFFTS